MKTKPLHLPVIPKLSFWQQLRWSWSNYKEEFFLNDIVEQVSRRTQEDQCQWEEYPAEIRDLARQISDLIVKMWGWPKASVFIPDDPVDVLIYWIDWVGPNLESIEIIMALEELLGIETSDEFWESARNESYSQLLQKLYEVKKQNQALEPTRGNAD